MGIKAFLSKNEKWDLITFVAGTGENYSRYKDYAESRGWKVFTPYYFHRWVTKNKPAIKIQRAMHVERVRDISMYDRERRIKELENGVIIIDSHLMNADSEVSPHKCDHCGEIHETLGPEVVMKMLEQKRKLLEQIAKERNEWLKTDERGVPTGNSIEAIRGLARTELVHRNGASEVISEVPFQDGMD